MPRVVLAIVSTARARDNVACIEGALTLGEVAEEVNRRFTLRACDDDVPSPTLRVCGH